MMRQPRVVVASRLFAPEIGAAAFRLKALVDGLVDRGADVQVLTTRAPHGEPAPATGAQVRRWPVLRDAGGNVRGYVQYLSFDIPLLGRLLATRGDVVVSEPPPTTGMVVALTSVLRRRPYVYYAADIWSEALAAMDVPGPVVSVMRAVEGAVLRRAAHVIAVSDAVADQVQRFGVDRARVTATGNGVDTTVFTPDGPAETAAHPVFVYTGTMSEWQGAEVFIHALGRVRRTHGDVVVRFFGQGADEGHLRTLAAELPAGAVVFGGVVSPREAAAQLRGATAALVSIKPDQGYDFAKPTKIYAAAACGTPVVFAGRGEGADVVRRNGLGTAADYDSEAVASAMVAAIEATPTPQERSSRVDWAREHASLAAVGRIAADTVLAACPRPGARQRGIGAKAS